MRTINNSGNTLQISHFEYANLLTVPEKKLVIKSMKQAQKVRELMFEKVIEFLTLKVSQASFIVIVRSTRPQCAENCGQEEVMHYFIPFHYSKPETK